MINIQQKNNPLHGITLQLILDQLVMYYGWEELGLRINIRCFNDKPSMKSSLNFLRKTPWAREKVECLYLYMMENRTISDLVKKTDSESDAKPINQTKTDSAFNTKYLSND